VKLNSQILQVCVISKGEGRDTLNPIMAEIQFFQLIQFLQINITSCDYMVQS